MAQLIEKLKRFSDNAQKQSADFERANMVMSSFNSGAMASAYKVAILAAEQLLETERQQIIDAYQHILNVDGEQYFTQTFTQK